MFRSIRAFLGNGTVMLHLGHFGLLLVTSTYARQLGQPVATGELDKFESFSSFSCSRAISLLPDEDDEQEGDCSDLQNGDLLLVGSLSALSRADLTLSSVHTLW